MLFIGNILTKEKINDTTLFNVTDKIEYLIPNINTLIIGWDKAKEIYPDASILNWKLDDMVYWTYGKRVKREKNEKDIQAFKRMALESVINKINYHFFSVLTSSNEEKRKFFTKIRVSHSKIALLCGDMLYLYIPDDKTSYGILLSDIDYEGGDRKRLLSTLYNDENTKFIKESDFMTYELRDLVKNKKYIIPFLSTLA